MNIVYAASEGVPFIKSGGLGDVIGSLPAEIRETARSVSVFLPKYKYISKEYADKLTYIDNITVSLSWREQHCGIFKHTLNNVDYYFIDNEYYFKRDGLYGYLDDGERFAFFSKAVLEVIHYLDMKIDLIHCHDWQTSLIPFFLKNIFGNNERLANIKTVLTIHNIKFQGWFPKEFLGQVLGLDYSYLTEDMLEYHGGINIMKGGIIFSDYITTVSNTYSEEIKTSYYGEGLDGVLQKHENKLMGILNGISIKEYSPSKDTDIFKKYNKGRLVSKYDNKANLQRVLGLEVDTNIPVISIISRLTEQKGLDLVRHILEELLTENIQLVVLGAGDYEYEEFFKYIEGKYSEKVFLKLGFDSVLAKNIYAGSDMFLMPSKFEPCGLGQMIAMRYGAVPVVRETGGLKDTVTNFSRESLKGNGYLFKNYNAHEMLDKIREALNDYKDKEVWNELVRNTMSTDVSWKKSAKQYMKLYKDLVGKTKID